MTKKTPATASVHVNLGDAPKSGLAVKVALVGLVVGFIMGAWLMNSWRSFNVSEAYEQRIEVLQDRQLAMEDSLAAAADSIEVAEARFQVTRAESDQLTLDLVAITAKADSARRVADELHAIADTTTAGLLVEVGVLRDALDTRETQCSTCSENADKLERGVQELLAIDTVKDRQIFTLNSITVDLQEALDLAQSELNRAGGRWGGWSAFGGPPVAIVGLAALALVLSW